MNKKIKLTDFEKNKENPFVKQAVEEINSNIVKKYRNATKTGESAILKAVDKDNVPIGHTTFVRQIEVDEKQFAKLYLSNFKSFFDLKPQAIKVFGYILTKLIPNRDEFMFFLDECKEYTEYKTAVSIHQGLACLLQNNIIARGRADNLYYINPMVAFNGNRITFAKTYVKRRKEIDANQTNINTQIEQLENGELKKI